MNIDANQLDLDEVNRRLDLATPGVTAELYSFGSALIAEVDRRFEYLDGKANRIAGYSGAIVAVIVSSIGTWPKAIDPSMVPVILFAAVAALVAGGMALVATQTTKLVSFSPNDWLREEYIKDKEELTKYWVSCIYVNRQTYSDRCTQKAKWIELSQYAFLFAASMLLVALLDAAWSSRALLNRLGVW